MNAFLLSLCLAAQPQDAPREYVEAERSGREFLGVLGVPTRGVRIIWGEIDPYEYGETPRSLRRNPDLREEAMTLGRRIWFDHTMTTPRPLMQKYMLHEFWHYYQQQRGGGSRYVDWAYARLGSATREKYLANAYEREAYFIQNVLYRVHRWRLRNPKGDIEGRLRAELRRAMPEMRAIWTDQPVRPRHLDRLEAELARVQDRTTWRRTALRELGGGAQFAAAYLVKEGLLALETADAARMREAVATMATPGFALSLGVFAAAAHGSARLLDVARAGRLLRASVPLAAGIAAVQLLSGDFSARDVAISTGAFLAAGLAVNVAADALVYPALFAAGPPGWIAGAAYTVAKLALALYAGEKLEAWIRGLLDRRASDERTRDGIAPRLEAIGAR